mgnify:CR=1 FL=1
MISIKGLIRFLYWNPTPSVLIYRLLYNFIATRSNCLVMRKVHGVKMVLNPCMGGIHRELFIYGDREPFSYRIFRKELRSLGEEGIVIDVGANIGYYCLLEAQFCKRVYAIEPSLRNLKYLLVNIAVNSLQDRIEVRRLAVGDHDGIAYILRGEAPNLDSISTRDTGEVVKMMTLDSFIAKERLERVDFVRMDIEGYECRMIKGAKRVLERFHPKLFIEIHPSMMPRYGDSIENLLNELSALGYQVKYAVWEPLVPVSLRLPNPNVNWRIEKSLSIRDLLNNPELRKTFLRDWTRLFLESS